MKRFKNILFVLIALVVVSVSCVDDDFDTPPYKEIPVGDVVTIANLKTYFDDSSAYINEEVGVAYKFKKDITVYATVTMDDKSGNLYKQAYIQDKTGGIALFFDASGGIQEGDTIRINLNGLIINQYAKAYQINSINGNGFKKQLYITTIDVSKRRTPEIVTISEINSNPPYYQGRLVKINDVQFVAGDTAQYYADYVNFITRNLSLENGSGQNIIVRTSGYASFADEKTPTGSGSITAVVGQFSNDMQLYIRNTTEVIMDNDRLGAGGGGTGDGSGTFDNPYDVAKAVANNSGENIWVEGYIVGVYETKDASGDLTNYVPSFTAPFYTNANIIIADTENETNIANCLIVQLLAGDIRTTLNLVDNVSNKGKLVKVYGDLMAYFGDEGLKNTSGYWLDGAGIVPATGFFEADFASSLGGFIQYSVAGASQVWEHSSTYKCAMMSGYDAGSRYANNDWLISPAMDLTSKTNVILNFVHAIGYGNYSSIGDELKLYASSNYSGSGDPSTATWVELSFAMPADLSTNFAWTNSGDVSLSAFDGMSNVYFAFNYNCGSTNASTWEVKDVVVSESVK